MKPSDETNCFISLDCQTKAAGVDYRIKAIPDAQMASHYSYGDHPASDGRLNAPQGWIGQNSNSWLQVICWFIVDSTQYR